jgi:hypothetical protein
VFQMVLTFVREILLYAQNDNPLETPEQLLFFSYLGDTSMRLSVIMLSYFRVTVENFRVLSYFFRSYGGILIHTVKP